MRYNMAMQIFTVKTRKKGILFFAVVAGIMLSSGVTIAVNPGQWFDVDDSSIIADITDEDVDAVLADVRETTGFYPEGAAPREPETKPKPKPKPKAKKKK